MVDDALVSFGMADGCRHLHSAMISKVGQIFIAQSVPSHISLLSTQFALDLMISCDASMHSWYVRIENGNIRVSIPYECTNQVQ